MEIALDRGLRSGKIGNIPEKFRNWMQFVKKKIERFFVVVVVLGLKAQNCAPHKNKRIKSQPKELAKRVMLLKMSYPICWVTVPRHMVCLSDQHSTDFAKMK